MAEFTILAATDLSPSCQPAVERAAMLARQFSGRLTLVHVVHEGTLARLAELLRPRDSVIDGMLDEPSPEALSETFRADTQQIADELVVEYGIAADVRVLHGAIATSLAEQADVSEADLLVFGAHGANAIRTWLLGSTAERALRGTTRPLLVVKQPPVAPYRRVLVPMDFSPHATEAFRAARQLAPEADVVLLHVPEIPFEGKLLQAGVRESRLQLLHDAAEASARSQFSEFLAATTQGDALVRTVVAHGDISLTIAEMEQEHSCDLIVMGKRGTSLLDEVFLGSVTRQVVSLSTCDVLVADRATQ